MSGLIPASPLRDADMEGTLPRQRKASPTSPSAPALRRAILQVYLARYRNQGRCLVARVAARLLADQDARRVDAVTAPGLAARRHREVRDQVHLHRIPVEDQGAVPEGLRNL